MLGVPGCWWLSFLLLFLKLQHCTLIVVKGTGNDPSKASAVTGKPPGNSRIRLHVPPNYLVGADTTAHPHHDDDDQEVTSTTTEENLPFFEEPYNVTNITAQLGQNVHLHCRINDLKDKTVTWVRRKGEELRLLTIGHNTYSSETRYIMEYEEPNDWRLLIRDVREADEGAYECQISSHPPLVYQVFLTVVVPMVVIADSRGSSAPDKFYKKGSTIELICNISKVPHPTGYVQWRHGNAILNYDTTRGGISVKTEMKKEGATSRLFVANVNKMDSGNYTCSLDGAKPTSVTVHVLNGEHADAMQYGSATRSSLSHVLELFTAMACLLSSFSR